MKHYKVVGAIIENNGQILCMQRPKGKFPSTDFKWEFPGGKVEEGETKPQALMRELREEMDFIIPIDDDCYFDVVHHVYPEFEITTDCYYCHASSREFRRKEHVDHKWLDPEELLTIDWAAADLPIAKKLQNYLLNKENQ